MLNKKFLIDITREVLNHSENEYLRSDFTDWCDGASAGLFLDVENANEPNLLNAIEVLKKEFPQEVVR